MKRHIVSLMAACCLSVAGAQAAPIAYTAVLSGPAEAPPNDSPGTGLATIVYDDETHTLQVDAFFEDLLGNTTASHIHCCTAVPFESTAGVATQLPSFIGFPLGVTAGTFSGLFDLTLAESWNPAFITSSGGTTAQAETRLAAGLAAGSAYFNIHTNLFPGGEIRGFTVPTPEPGVISLMALAMTSLACMKRRRR